MDARTERAALLALLRDLTRGWGDVADAVEEAGSAYTVLRERLTQGQGDLFAPGADDELDVRLTAASDAMLAWESEGIHLVTVLDEEYPEKLRGVHQRPPFLTYRGRLDPIDAGGIAVVGTRHPSERGLEQAAEIASGLAERGVTVVSGLAQGIDTAAHTAALAAGGRTVAVIGTGLRRAYPRENAELQAHLGRDHLVLSQFWPDSPPTQHSFPMRNAVMSGYAAATVVVEAAAKSGAKMQARLALEHGRPVFLLDTLLDHAWAREYAARPATTVVSGPDAVLEGLREVLTPVTELFLA